MNNTLLRLYHRSPAWLRSAAASARGYQLRAWRYGAGTERLIEEALAREQWSAPQWQEWQSARLAYVLDRAATTVPYYRELWRARRRRGDLSSWEHLENWPVLEKETLREHSRAFVADNCDRRRMFRDHTSGTTGKSLDLWLTRSTVRHWYALCEARWRLWHGVSRHDRWAILGGQLVTPAARRRPPFWVWNAGLGQLYMSSYHLAPDLVPHYVDALRRHRVKYLLGYTSALYVLGQAVLAAGRRDLQMSVVITNAEPLYTHQREVIAEAFRCPVRETYGMAEIVAAAGECPAGQLHLWPDAGIVEVLAEGQPSAAAHGASGELICTGLVNADMPLIRYRVGDRATFADAKLRCGCGRTLPPLASIDGRTQDTLYTADGRSVGCIDTVYGSDLPLREAQIIQETLGRVRVRYVPAPGWTPASGRTLVAGMRARMGEVEVVLEKVSEVPRAANGKFRPVICDLSAADLARLEGASR